MDSKGILAIKEQLQEQQSLIDARANVLHSELRTPDDDLRRHCLSNPLSQ